MMMKASRIRISITVITPSRIHCFDENGSFRARESTFFDIPACNGEMGRDVAVG
jgi:hypothetical protein